MNAGQSASDARALRTLAREALARYGLRDVELRLAGRVHNHVFRVTANHEPAGVRRRYALRLHLQDWLSDEEIASELAWLESLGSDMDIAVPAPVRNRDGELLTHAGPDGRRTCTLLRWLPGRVYWRRPSRSWVGRTGKLMAELQAHGRRFARPAAFVRRHRDVEAITGRVGRLAAGSANLPRPASRVLEAVFDRFERAVRDVGTGPRTFGLIHGDLHVGNAVLDRGRAGVIDFDDCGDGYYLFDLAAALDMLEFRDDYAVLRKALLAGYESVRPLSSAEATNLNAFLAARWATVCLYLARDPSQAPRVRRVLKLLLPKFRRFLKAPDSLG